MPKTKKTATKATSSSSHQKPRAEPKKVVTVCWGREVVAPPTDGISASERAKAFIKMMSVSPKYRGKVQVRSAKDYKTPYFLRRPTGILELDLALGGGFPAGGASQLYGARSSGKTHISFCTAGQVQQNYGDESIIALGLSELRGDIGFMRMSGFCVAYSKQQIEEYENIRLSNGLPGFTPEERADLEYQIGEVIFLGGSTGGDMLESTLEVADQLGSRCQLMIVDSLGSLLTPAQDSGTITDQHYGGSSGIITTWQTKMGPKFINDLPDGSLLETTILGINQVRALIGGPRPGMTRPAAGAKSWEHAQLVNVEFKQGEPLWKDSKHTQQSGREVNWTIKKGKAGCHDGAKGSVNWYYFKQNEADVYDPVFWKDVQDGTIIGGADRITDLVGVAKSMGIIEIGGAWRTVKDQNGQVLLRVQGDEAVAEKLANDPELEAVLKEGCLRASGLTVRYR
jgi:RecA/RadA recombinase